MNAVVSALNLLQNHWALPLLSERARARGVVLPRHGFAIGTAVLAVLHAQQRRPYADTEIDIVVPLAHPANEFDAMPGSGTGSDDAQPWAPHYGAVSRQSGPLRLFGVHGPLRIRRLLERVDIDLLQVAIDLATGEVITTRQFDQAFADGRHAHITSLATPAATLQRYALLRSYFGVQGNDRSAFQALSAAQAYPAERAAVSGWLLSHQAWEQARLALPMLDQWFSAVEDQGQLRLMGSHAGGVKPGRLLRADNRLLNLPQALDLLPLAARALGTERSATVHPTAMGLAKGARALRYLCQKWSEHGWGFLDVAMGPEQLGKMERLVGQRHLASVLHGDTIGTLAQQLGLIERQAKRHARWVWHAMHDVPARHWTQEALAPYLDGKLRELQARLCEPTLPNLHLGAFKVSELCSRMALLEQAHRPDHPVARLCDAADVAAGRLRVLAIRGTDIGDWFTLSLSPGPWRIRKLSAYSGRAVPPDVWQCAQRYLGCTLLVEYLGVRMGRKLAAFSPAVASIAGHALDRLYATWVRARAALASLGPARRRQVFDDASAV